ncbi:hypothetical protein L9F63_000576, partial [Diploptera punctata]
MFSPSRLYKHEFPRKNQKRDSLPDGSPSFKSFIDSRYNRFLTPVMACKNRIVPPSK